MINICVKKKRLQYPQMPKDAHSASFFPLQCEAPLFIVTVLGTVQMSLLWVWYLKIGGSPCSDIKMLGYPWASPGCAEHPEDSAP